MDKIFLSVDSIISKSHNMIIKCETLNKYFTFLPNLEATSPNLEIYNENSENIYIAFNYNDQYYLKMKLDTECGDDLLLSTDALKKLIKIVQLWPKATLNILDCQIEIVSSEPSIRETNVEINCMYSSVDYTRMISPEYVCTHEVNIRSFMKVLDLCTSDKVGSPSDKVALEPRPNKLTVSNTAQDTIASMDCLTINDSSSIELNCDSIKFVLIFLSKLTQLTCKLCINKESAFIISTGTHELFCIHTV